MKYKRIVVEIPAGAVDQKIDFGDYFKSFLIVSASQSFDYKVNSTANDALKFDEIQGFQKDGVFHSIYVSSPVAVTAAVVVYK
ncbi:hypothetical protein ABEX78_32295 [Priestia megaterium]